MGAVAVNLLEGDLPLVVTLLTVDRDHRIERRAVAEPQFDGVLDSFVQLVVAVDQQFAGHLRPGRGQVERQAVGLGVPIGDAAVFLAREALGTDIEAGVDSGVGLQKHKDTEADALLRRRVAPITMSHPCQRAAHASSCSFSRASKPVRRASAATARAAAARSAETWLSDEQMPAYLYNVAVRPASQRTAAVWRTCSGCVPQRNSAPSSSTACAPCGLETALAGAALRDVGVGCDRFPEFLVVVGVGIAHIGVDIRRKGDFGGAVQRRDGIADDAQFAARQRQKADGLDRDFDARCAS